MVRGKVIKRITITTAVSMLLLVPFAVPVAAHESEQSGAGAHSGGLHSDASDPASVRNELRSNGGTITATAGGESMDFKVSGTGKVESQGNVPVPYCGKRAKNQALVRSDVHAKVSGFARGKAKLRCGSYGKGGWGLRHIGENHKEEWTGKASGGDWYELMTWASKQALSAPEKAPRQPNDTYAYCTTVELQYRGKVFDRFKTVTPVSHKGENIITSFTAAKCK